jgi:hypothetical protein
MKPNGFNVEFLPLERRLLERRFIDTAPSFFEHERRFSDRRETEHTDLADQLDFDPNTSRTLTH